MSLAIAFAIPCHRHCHAAATLFFQWTVPHRSPIAMQSLEKPLPPISLSGGGPLRSRRSSAHAGAKPFNPTFLPYLWPTKLSTRLPSVKMAAVGNL
ncbi:hypothetical protein B296_00044014 [Ensete ventricosum]|uniref:Uncharacterized protein n=1 Tax=Ensete ventricosum TaxID=4639 RepID=A0A426YE34_ENSVE|nr:hypothetical protein B296_00044014 [Ensete ventricosum]